MPKAGTVCNIKIFSSGTEDNSVDTWNIKFVKKVDAGGSCGSCDYNKKEIHIYNRLRNINRISTTIHETIHASAPFLSEESVVALEKSIIQIIKKEIAND